jgi:hypothetical protein
VSPEPPELNVKQLGKNWELRVGPEEHDAEREARLRREERRDKAEHFKGVALFVVAVGGIVALGTACGWVALDAQADAETRKWAQTLLTAIVSGGLAFLFGRALPKG